MELIVPDDKLSLAIGKKGQNVRLASQLSGWRIDIHSESKIHELETRAKAQIGEIEGVGIDLADVIFRLGWRSVTDVARAIPEELAQVPGVGSLDRSRAIVAGARRFLEHERTQARRPADEATEAAAPPPAPAARGLDEGWNG
jgi:N utilization substance protein A